MRASKKNFSYGELWMDNPKVPQAGRGRSKEDPADYTTNSAFINYLKANHYDFYVDFDMEGVAHTNVTHREVVVNGNYTDEMISVFLQHELGHLMLFDVNQFVTVGRDTLRSVIAKILYTPDHLVKYGIQQLLYVENVIQDVIIETLSNGDCVCRGALSTYGVNLGVKHLETLENTKLIAKEACDTILKSKTTPPPDFPPSPELESILDSMLKDLKKDIEEIEKKMEDTKESEHFKHEKNSKRHNEIRKTQQNLDKIKSKIERNGDPTGKLEGIKKKLEDQLKDAKSKDREKQDERDAEEAKQKALENLQKKLDNAKDLLDQLQKAKEEAEARNSSEGPPQDGEVTKELHKNTTDHLSTSDEGTGGHSYDCGLPHPLTVSRDESIQNENNMVRINAKPNVKKIHIDEDSATNVLSNKIKTPENELTYFKSNKKEFDETDMLKGKRKLRVSGINVLVGLDISGSMVNEWGVMFTELSAMVQKFQETLDIEKIVYFTYHHDLVDYSYDLEDLKLKAGGGNAFGYVYQKMMQELPVMQRNEIILVTDCGDNLGFRLNDACEVERNGSEVENHISIIDTENAGFYDKTNFDDTDWSLYRHDDPRIQSNIRASIERLIEK